MRAKGTNGHRDISAFKRTFRHIGAKDAWSWKFAFFCIYVISLISFLTDSVRLNSFDWRWIPVSGIAFLPPLAIAVCYRVLYLDRKPDKSRPVLNLLVAAMAGSARNISAGLFAGWAGLDRENLFTFRFVGGAALGIAIFTIWSISQGTTTDYLAALRRLSNLQSDLAASREDMPHLLSDVNENLQARARSSILPQLDQISKSLAENRTARDAVSELRNTLSSVVRPLLNEMAGKAPLPFQERNIESLAYKKTAVPNRYRLFDSLSVASSAITQAIGYGFWLTFAMGVQGIIHSLIAIVMYGATFCGLKVFVPRRREFTKETATALTIAMAMISSGVTCLYLATIPVDMVLLLSMFGVLILSGTLTPVMFAHATIRQKTQLAMEAQIEDELSKIAKENSLFAQRVWVFRKRWLLLLHGTVQSAVTAAVNRLQSAEEIDELTVQLVKQDLLRAERAINVEPSSEINFESAMKELREVWNGICDVEVQVSERARRALQRNSDSAFCVNEIAKEAISNAVRHGAAHKAQIDIDRIEDDLLHIEITNDGISPRNSGKQGIGSQMLDEICLGWELVAKPRAVVLFADLPIRI